MHNKKTNNSKTTTFIQGLRPLSNSLPQGLKKLLRKGGYNFSNIVDNWVKMVGRDISDKCYPNTIRMGKDMSNGTLILNVVHGNELSIEYSKQLIIDKINSFFGYNCVKEIKLKIIQEKRIKSNFKSIKKTRKYENKLDQIENEKIKNSLNNLIKAYNDKTE
mgnify:CR=1 FL=1|tara:strand:+ start:140 stop:625 length:486 start_codon:yes stop_codon:yes gene_type:complete